MSDTPEVAITAKSVKLDIHFHATDESPRRNLQFSFSNENLHSIARLLFMYQLGFTKIPATKAVIPFKHTCNGTTVESKSPFTWSLCDGVLNFNLDENVFVHSHWACAIDLAAPLLIDRLGIGNHYALAGRVKGHPSVFAYKHTYEKRVYEMVLLTDRKSFYVVLARSKLDSRGWYSVFGYNQELIYPEWNAMQSKEFRGEQAELCDRYGYMVQPYTSVDDFIVNGVIVEDHDSKLSD